MIIEYKEGENRGGLTDQTTSKVWPAYTAILSRTFKTRKGAEKWLASRRYEPVKSRKN